MKKIARGVRRHFHDDISVVVVYLDQHKPKNGKLVQQGGITAPPDIYSLRSDEAKQRQLLNVLYWLKIGKKTGLHICLIFYHWCMFFLCIGIGFVYSFTSKQWNPFLFGQSSFDFDNQYFCCTEVWKLVLSLWEDWLSLAWVWLMLDDVGMNKWERWVYSTHN